MLLHIPIHLNCFPSKSLPKFCLYFPINVNIFFRKYLVENEENLHKFSVNINNHGISQMAANNQLSYGQSVRAMTLLETGLGITEVAKRLNMDTGQDYNREASSCAPTPEGSYSCLYQGGRDRSIL